MNRFQIIAISWADNKPILFKFFDEQSQMIVINQEELRANINISGYKYFVLLEYKEYNIMLDENNERIEYPDKEILLQISKF